MEWLAGISRRGTASAFEERTGKRAKHILLVSIMADINLRRAEGAKRDLGSVPSRMHRARSTGYTHGARALKANVTSGRLHYDFLDRASQPSHGVRAVLLHDA